MKTEITAAVIGGGVIGSAWAARFLLNGWNVNLYDPDPESTRKMNDVLTNARRSLTGLTDYALPEEGKLSHCTELADAVSNADWIQESVPERLDVKQQVYRDIQQHAPASAVLASSTSGFKPSELAEGATRPNQILVCHPFNPVYLLPLVEVVPHEATDSGILQTARDLLTEIGMKPLLVRKEIDAHIADRLLEAVWRESLWLIKDRVATTEEIDDVIRFGFGLRWAQMGLFETYRLAGGEAGMEHFIAQFGPCLAWPWTKLMDVPELTDDLIKTIASQSDEQSGSRSIRDLEQIRDNNLVAMMRALKYQNWGAGNVLNDHDQLLVGNRFSPETIESLDLTKPVRTVERVVPLDWIDYNGHMTESRYLHAFADSTDRFMLLIGCDEEYISSGGSYFTAETHIRHIDEVHAGAGIHVDTQCLLGEGKKMHLFHSLYEGERLLATGEHMLIHVSLETRSSSPPAPHIEKNLVRIARAHADLETPPGTGSAVGKRT